MKHGDYFVSSDISMCENFHMKFLFQQCIVLNCVITEKSHAKCSSCSVSAIRTSEFVGGHTRKCGIYHKIAASREQLENNIFACPTYRALALLPRISRNSSLEHQATVICSRNNLAVYKSGLCSTC